MHKVSYFFTNSSDSIENRTSNPGSARFTTGEFTDDGDIFTYTFQLLPGCPDNCTFASSIN